MFTDRLRAQGLRPVQIWVPDVRSAAFAAAAHAQSAAVAAGAAGADDQAFVDAISEEWDPRVRRGDLHVASARGAYTGKLRPVVIVQDGRFDATTSVTVCPVTTALLDAPLLRIRIEPGAVNGLRLTSDLMLDKITTVPRVNLGERLGRLDDDELLALARGLVVFLGLA